jgi:uncharacterized protein (DUF433 family)
MPIDSDDLPQRTLKPTIRDIVRTVGTEGAAADLPETAILGAVFATIREHYPDMTSEQIAAAIRAEVDAWVVRLDEADFWDDFDDAVALDPDWYVSEDRCTCCRPGTLYNTPEKLVAAYRAWRDGTGTGGTSR